MPPLSLFWHHTRRTLALAAPIIVGQVGQMLMGVVDSVMIGQVGTVPLAASAFAGSMFGLFFVGGVGLLVPISIFVSREHGAGRPEACAVWLRHGFWVGLGVGLATMAAMLAVGTQLHRFGQPAEVVAVAQPFFTLIALSLLPTFVFQVFRQYAESLGRPAVPMWTMLAGVVLNAALNWILIYGNLGAPALGLTGAGWVTLTARVLTLVFLVLWIRRDRAFAPSWPGAWGPRLDRVRLRAMAELGVPAALSLSFEVGAFTVAAWMMGWLGATALAAHQIAISCAAFTFMFPLGLAMAVSIRLSQEIGKEDTSALRVIALGAQALSFAVMVVCALVFAFGGERIAAGFVDDPEVVRLAGVLLLWAAVFQLFDGAQVVGVGVLRGLSDVKVPTLITGVAYWGVALPGAWWFGLRGSAGAEGVWAAMAAGLAVAAVCVVVRFLALTRRR